MTRLDKRVPMQNLVFENEKVFTEYGLYNV
jgi:hypothetical protein